MCAGQVQQQVDADGNPVQSGSSWYIIVIYVVIFAAFIYFIMIRPQKKQKKQQEETMNAMEPGDSVPTTSGFYGTRNSLAERKLKIRLHLLVQKAHQMNPPRNHLQNDANKSVDF